MQSRFSVNSYITIILILILLAFYLIMTSCKSFGTFMGKRADKSAQRQLARTTKYLPVDVLIVPGIPFENGKWDRIMKARVIWSWVLYKNGYVKNVIYSGDAVYSPYKEGSIMALYAEKLGIPEEHVFYETRARHSTENVYYSYLLAKEKGFKTIALGTDPYFQSPTLKSFTKRRFASYIHHIPFVKDSLTVYDYLDPVIDPLPAKVDSFSSIMHQESFRERFRGTLGKDIDWSKYEEGRLEQL